MNKNHLLIVVIILGAIYINIFNILKPPFDIILKKYTNIESIGTSRYSFCVLKAVGFLLNFG